jgi:hypothetical protein
MKNKIVIIESFIFLLISSIIYACLRYKNPDNIIGRYYMTESRVLYNLFKISSIIIQFTLFFNLKFLIVLLIKSYLNI